MSGRLAQFNPPLADPPTDWQPSWNLSPGQPILILRRTERQLECARVLWKLTPGWMRELDKAPFNVRAEWLLDKAQFSQPLAQRRCLLPIDGYYLWHQRGSRKQPWYLRRQSGGLAVAGLWERYQLDDGQFWDSCALISVPAKGLARQLGERMPATLNRGEQAIWLADATAFSALQPLLLNAASQVELIHPVNPAMSNPGLQGPTCCAPSGRSQSL
ncbi:SOS response-associated peptidase [Halopseudomonas salegens]|uniref:Abasic site processing protein n=1 Tax=Halopseudomonas salegens TaxID=1434072 RepID=A0A1H2G0C7_9GAMM|nr:SOS response-associated peptidase [Halopseudomonas salegens]SDU13017.1 Putative SOS response-associated peptidase YedK [Halopseudomonas salegens]